MVRISSKQIDELLAIKTYSFRAESTRPLLANWPCMDIDEETLRGWLRSSWKHEASKATEEEIKELFKQYRESKTLIFHRQDGRIHIRGDWIKGALKAYTALYAEKLRLHKKIHVGLNIDPVMIELRRGGKAIVKPDRITQFFLHSSNIHTPCYAETLDPPVEIRAAITIAIPEIDLQLLKKLLNGALSQCGLGAGRGHGYGKFRLVDIKQAER